MGSANGRPNAAAWVAKRDHLPFESVKLALRRTAYRKFNGGANANDGFGRNAADNNSWLLLGWFMF